MPTDFNPAALKAHRENAEMTQTALALLVNLTPAAISLIESGDRTPSLGTLTALADALGIRVGRFFRRTNGKSAEPKRRSVAKEHAA